MKPPLLALLMLVPILVSQPARAVVHGHCNPVKITPVVGDPGAYRLESARGTTIARLPSRIAPRTTAAQIAVFRVYPNSFDADGDTLGTVHDTIVVAPGTTVRWVRAGPGFHTVTSGADSGDPNASNEYNDFMSEDPLVNEVEHVFTTLGKHDFFCFIHEPTMEGTVIVTSATAGVGPTGVLHRATFTRPPSPNPTRGDISFAVAVPRTGAVSLTVHDVAGREVARISSDVLTAGEHPFHWDARAANGRPLGSGRYFIRLSAPGVRETKAVSLIR
jgi:plastocyanin